MSITDHLLSCFGPVTLDEMNGIRLLNRIDTKFLFAADTLPVILEKLKNHYRVLEVCGVRMQRYETIYFDTPGHQMYLQHHNGKLNRYKIRFRRYVDSNLGFFEIKFKNNRRRTIKERIPFDGTGETIGGSALEFLRQTAPFPAESLNPSLHISFTRTTFVNHSLSERLTLDTNLTFVHEGKEKSYPGLVVAELKQDKNAVSVFKTIMRKEHIPACSISKYCLGIISLNPTVKKNNFKPKLEIIKKITHDLS